MRRTLVLLSCSILLAACSDDTVPPGGADLGGGSDFGLGDMDVVPVDGATPTDGAPLSDLGPGVVITEDGGFMWTCRRASCGGRVTECGDCIDNDGDGTADERDRECLGPCDNTEGPALTAGVGGETGGPCQSDCYFDFGNGSGNDDCFWDHRCDPLSVAPNFPPEGDSCPFEASRVGGRTCPATQSDTCGEVCRPVTPNGCDCFGCCTFDEISGRAPGAGGPYVWIGSVFDGTNNGSCTFADVEDTSLCKPCTPVGDCLNECGRCELCIGRDPASLPADCFPPPPTDGGVPSDMGTPSLRCDPGVQACGLPGDALCGPDYYCVTGCCVSTFM